MADIAQSSLTNSGYFKATTCTGTLSIAAGSSGTLLTVSSTGGRKIRLTMLSVQLTGSEAGVSVTADGVAVLGPLTLATNLQSSGSFSIGYGQDSSGRPYNGNVQFIEANNTITITKASGSTAGTIYYALEQGF